MRIRPEASGLIEVRGFMMKRLASTVQPDRNAVPMRNQRFIRVVIFIVVAGMVMTAMVAALSVLS